MRDHTIVGYLVLSWPWQRPHRGARAAFSSTQREALRIAQAEERRERDVIMVSMEGEIAGDDDKPEVRILDRSWSHRLRRIRQTLGWSQARLGRALDVRDTRVSQWESGQVRPSASFWPGIHALEAVAKEVRAGTKKPEALKMIEGAVRR